MFLKLFQIPLYMLFIFSFISCNVAPKTEDANIAARINSFNAISSFVPPALIEFASFSFMALQKHDGIPHNKFIIDLNLGQKSLIAGVHSYPCAAHYTYYSGTRYVDFIVSEEYPNKFIIDLGNVPYTAGRFRMSRYILVTKEEDGLFYGQSYLDVLTFSSDLPKFLFTSNKRPLGNFIDDSHTVPTSGKMRSLKETSPSFLIASDNTALEFVKNKTIMISMNDDIGQVFFKMAAKNNYSRYGVSRYVGPWLFERYSERKHFNVITFGKYKDRFIIDTQMESVNNNNYRIDRYYLIYVNSENQIYARPLENNIMISDLTLEQWWTFNQSQMYNSYIVRPAADLDHKNMPFEEYKTTGQLINIQEF